MMLRSNSARSFLGYIYAFSPSILIIKKLDETKFEYPISEEMYQMLSKYSHLANPKNVFRFHLNENGIMTKLEHVENFTFNENKHYAYFGTLDSVKNVKLTMDGGIENDVTKVCVTRYSESKENQNSVPLTMTFVIKEENADLIHDLMFRSDYLNRIPFYFRSEINVPFWFIYHKEGIPGEETEYLDMILSNLEFAYYSLDTIEEDDPDADPHPVYDRYQNRIVGSINSVRSDFAQGFSVLARSAETSVEVQYYGRDLRYADVFALDDYHEIILQVPDPFLARLLQVSATQNKTIFAQDFVLYLDPTNTNLIGIGLASDTLPSNQVFV